jgi:hypothetical protein
MKTIGTRLKGTFWPVTYHISRKHEKEKRGLKKEHASVIIDIVSQTLSYPLFCTLCMVLPFCSLSDKEASLKIRPKLHF